MVSYSDGVESLCVNYCLVRGMLVIIGSDTHTWKSTVAQGRDYNPQNHTEHCFPPSSYTVVKWGRDENWYWTHITSTIGRQALS